MFYRALELLIRQPMIMSYTKLLIIFLFFLFFYEVRAQENFESLGETAFSVNHEVSDNYKTNFALRSRYFLYKDKNLDFENRQIDVVHFSTLNLNYNHSISLGVQYRNRASIDGGSNELRLTQQFNYTKRNEALRFGHRFRFEQRILSDLTILRSRYRFAVDLPLNGVKLDVGEAYLVLSMEALLSQGKIIKPELDYRTTGNIGWVISKKSKLQFGLEYRFEAFNIATEHRLFILSSFILKV